MLSNWNRELNDAIRDSKVLCVAVFKPDGSMVSANAAMSSLFMGKPSENFINPSFDDLVTITKENPFIGYITIGRDTAMNNSIQAKVFQKDDELLIVGEIDIMQVSKQNISLSKIMHENSNLQRALIKEKKVLQITNEKLAQINESQNTLLGTAAHDLRNPIGTALSYTDLLVEYYDELSQDELKLHLGNIKNATSFSLNLLNSLLDLSKIKSGKIELEIESENYLRLIETSIENNSLFAKNKKILIELESAYKVLHTNLDQVRIIQVLNNLLSNAIKYSEEFKNITVRVSKEQNQIKTEIIDQGLGIDPEEIEILFEPFHTASSRPTGGEKSTGLGLAIVKKVIELHQGELKVYSEKGKGSNFTFWLPLTM